MNLEPSNDLKPPRAFGVDPVERIFKVTRAYLDAPSGIDIKMHIGFSARMEPAIMVRIHGLDYALLYGSTAGTTSIGLTKVLNAADGMEIQFDNVTKSSTILDATGIFPLASAKNLTTAENDAVAMLPGAGVVYFTFQGNEYFIATNNNEVIVSADDAIVKLVGVTDIHHATNSGGLVTLHV
jgi:hypothetical protein